MIQPGAALAAAFLIGAVPTSWIVVRIRTGQDIRSLGSGNPGATNVFRSVGRKTGIAVLVVDALKGWGSAVWLPLAGIPSGFLEERWRLCLGLAAVAGHVFTPFLKFRGGKGVAAGAGVAFAVFPLEFLAALSLWSAVLWRWRIMSIASLSAIYLFTGIVFFTRADRTVFMAIFLSALFLTWTHRANLLRLFQGKEHRI